MPTKKESLYYTGDTSIKTYGSQQENNFDNVVIPRGRAIATDRTFINHDTNISVKSDYNYKDYDYFRPSQTVPIRKEEIIAMCMTAYKKVGLVRNVIDLMGDFGAQGIRLQHPDPKLHKFYNTWWEKINGQERSERFLNTLYRCGQTIIKKSYGSVSVFEEKKWRKGTAKSTDDVKIEKIKTRTRQIPLRYIFMDPLSVEIMSDELAQFVGNPVLGLKINNSLKGAITRAMSQKELAPQVKKLIEKIPSDVLAAIKRGDRLLPLDPDKTSVYYYKRDDWELWADPMCYCILDDLLMLNQLKLADRSALDGAISNIRLWTLGIIGDSPANSILPTKTSLNKLRNILANNVGGGGMDLVWGPELSFTESNSQVWRWLGSEKYDITIRAIYEGLGIPISLRGSSGGTNTGNFIGLNTLVKRLQYGRDQLVSFWNTELKYVHKAMGFPGAPPQIMFDFMALADEAAEKQLLIHLWDRDIISDDTILELFGRLPDVEKARVKYEHRDRVNERMPYKASPFHNPDKEDDFRKILLQSGTFAPSEIGIDLQDRKAEEQSQMERQHDKEKDLMNMEMKHDVKMQDKQNQFDDKFKQQEVDNKFELDKQRLKENMKIKRQQMAGRPKNVTETKKRKSKPADKPSTRAFVDTFMWANGAQEQISSIITPALLHAYGKKNVRSLSNEEFIEVEKIKFNILCSLEPFSQITSESVYNELVNCKTNVEILGMVKAFIAQFVAREGREPKVDEARQIYSSSYALYYE